jgi:hypothetical protein
MLGYHFALKMAQAQIEIAKSQAASAFIRSKDEMARMESECRKAVDTFEMRNEFAYIPGDPSVTILIAKGA